MKYFKLLALLLLTGSACIIFSCSDREQYSAIDYDSVYITKSTFNSRRETTISDTVFINSFLKEIYKCTPVATEKFKTKYSYSFTFRGPKKKVFLDLLLLTDGRIILSDSNSIWQADQRFDASSMSKFIDYVDKLTMRRLY